MVQQSSPNTLSYFDYGTACIDFFMRPIKCNQQAYGSNTPPLYNLGQVNTPLAIYTGEPTNQNNGGVQSRVLQGEGCVFLT